MVPVRVRSQVSSVPVPPSFMRIHVRFSALRNIRAHEYVIRFLFGGSVTLGAALVAQQFGPVVGGLFLRFPPIFPRSVTLLAKHQERRKKLLGLNGTERGKLAAALDSRGAAIGSCTLFLFALTVWLLLHSSQLAAVLRAGTIVWFLSSIAIWSIRTKSEHD
jgi:hypothetical protein